VCCLLLDRILLSSWTKLYFFAQTGIRANWVKYLVCNVCQLVSTSVMLFVGMAAVEINVV